MTTRHLTIDPVINPNYVATIVRIGDGDLYAVPGLDNLVGYSQFGMQALTTKDTPPGLYILFSTEVQLSLEYAAANNLHRDQSLNDDPEATVGYLEQNRRVKAIKLKGNRSESLLMPLDSLRPIVGEDVLDLKEGDVFDSLNGAEICRKYIPRGTKDPNGNQPKAKIRRVDEKVFPQHVDTENYFRNSEKVPDLGYVAVTQKLHGTSVRYGNVLTLLDRKWWERLLRRPFKTAYRFVVGSRRTIKSIDLAAEGGQDHWYADGDLWTRYAEQHKIADKLPKDHIIYGELVGWTGPGAPIQRDYTYDVPDGEARLYVYRVAVVTTEGHIVDMPFEQMRQFCRERGLLTAPLLWRGLHDKFNSETDAWLEKRYYDEWSTGMAAWYCAETEAPVPLSHKKLVDEGVVVRYEGPHGIFVLKAKSPSFVQHETKMLDAEAEDLESAA